jgi:hypothetical protein
VSLFAPSDEISLPEVSGLAEVLALVNGCVVPRLPANAALISVDGLDGSGKSEIGRAIAHLTDRSLIQIDDFLEKHQGQFVQALRMQDLQRALAADEPTVIEGCLVGSILQRMAREADFQIYVARTGQMMTDPQHQWCDEHELLFGTATAADLIEEEERNLRAFCKSGLFGMVSSDDAGLPALRKELINYHREFQPHRRADLIVRVVRYL